MTAAYLDTQPHLLEKWASLNPLGRIGRPDELRGVVAWLASDASTFCTGSEYVSCLIVLRLRNGRKCERADAGGVLLQHSCERRPSCVVT